VRLRRVARCGRVRVAARGQRPATVRYRARGSWPGCPPPAARLPITPRRVDAAIPQHIQRLSVHASRTLRTRPEPVGAARRRRALEVVLRILTAGGCLTMETFGNLLRKPSDGTGPIRKVLVQSGQGSIIWRHSTALRRVLATKGTWDARVLGFRSSVGRMGSPTSARSRSAASCPTRPTRGGKRASQPSRFPPRS
jgi:hypothetical protein